MCGISGIISKAEVTEKLSDSIKRLEYRGYDSCGIAIFTSDKKLEIRKNVGFVDDVYNKEKFFELKGNIGLAHTRWATHGKVTKDNAHPLLSFNNKFVIVHNGIIDNHLDLKKDLSKRRKCKFRSTTDTEVIVNLIADYYESGLSVEKSFTETIKVLEGTFALALFSILTPDTIYLARKGSPLIIGLGEGENYIGSDYNAFISYTKRSVIMEDNEYAMVRSDDYTLKDLHTGRIVKRDLHTISWDSEMSSKGGFPHYMLKEIYEQPQIIKRSCMISDEDIRRFAESILSNNKFYMTGVGTTFFIAQTGQYYFSKYAGITPNVISSDEFKFLSNVDDKTFLLAISQSGETYDTISAIKYAKKLKAKTAAIVNVEGSSIARLVELSILQRSGPEISVISTKSALSQIMILARISITSALMSKNITEREFQIYTKSMELLPNKVEKLLNEHSGIIHTIARNNAKVKHWFFLGRGRYYPIARESALKMKEVSYIHAEGMPSGFLKHGALALVDEELNSVVFIPSKSEKELYDLTISSAEEIRARNGYVLGIGSTEHKSVQSIFSDMIMLPKTDSFTMPIIQLIAAQILSYYTATTLGRNVDRPRSLAKSVTVY